MVMLCIVYCWVYQINAKTIYNIIMYIYIHTYSHTSPCARIFTNILDQKWPWCRQTYRAWSIWCEYDMTDRCWHLHYMNMHWHILIWMRYSIYNLIVIWWDIAILRKTYAKLHDCDTCARVKTHAFLYFLRATSRVHKYQLFECELQGTRIYGQFYHKRPHESWNLPAMFDYWKARPICHAFIATCLSQMPNWPPDNGL